MKRGGEHARHEEGGKRQRTSYPVSPITSASMESGLEAISRATSEDELNEVRHHRSLACPLPCSLGCFVATSNHPCHFLWLSTVWSKMGADLLLLQLLLVEEELLLLMMLLLLPPEELQRFCPAACCAGARWLHRGARWLHRGHVFRGTRQRTS